MRVAVVTTSWPRDAGDAAGHFVEADVRRMARCGGADVEVIAADGDAFGWPGFAARVRQRPWRAVGAGAWVMRARQRLESGGFDRVVAHWAVPSAWPIATTGLARFALEVVSHGGDVRLLARMPGPVRARIVRRIAERAESWRFVAEHLARAVASSVPADVARAVERVTRIEASAIDVDTPSAEDVAEKRSRVGQPFVVCVGRLIALKRVDAAIAWASREKRTLVVVGDGPEREHLERAARVAATRVLFVGTTPRREALAWIAASDLVVSASIAEGLSTVRREADALGVTFVAIQSGS